MSTRILSLRTAAVFAAATALSLPGLSAQLVENEVVVPAGSTWEYLLYAPESDGFLPSDPVAVDPDFHTTWYLGTAGGYDGPEFLSGAGPLGYDTVTNLDPLGTDIWGLRDGATQPPAGSRRTAYFRTTFTPTEAANQVRISSIIDDGAIIYIDGVEVARTDNFDVGAVDAWDLMTIATGSETAEVGADIPVDLEAGVEVVLAVSLHNNGVNADSSDTGIDLRVATLQSPDPTPPSNDNFAAAELVPNDLPVTVTGRTHDGAAPSGLGATLEGGEPAHAGVANVGSIWYTFNPLEDGLLRVSVGASSFTAVVAVYTGNSLGALSPVASATDNIRFYQGATVIFEGSSAETYYIAVCGESNGGAAILDENFGDVSLTIQEQPTSLFTPITTLLPAGSEWEYLLVAEDDPADPLLTNQPVDPALAGAGDPDFRTTWHTAGSYDGPAFSGPAPALLGYGLINADPILTDIWGGRDIDADPDTDDTAPPSGLRYASYFRTTFTPAAPVAHLGFRGLIDDGAVIFINGVEVSNINFVGDPSDWQAFALDAVATEDAPQEGIGLDVNLPAGVPVEIGVTVRSNTATSSDIGFDLEVFSIQQPLFDFGKDLAANDPLRAGFESAAPFETAGLGDGGPDDNLPWVASNGFIQSELAVQNPPPADSNAIYVNQGAINFVSGNIDLRGVDNSQVSVSVDLRASYLDTDSGAEAADVIDAFIEGSTDGILFSRLASIADLAGDGDPLPRGGGTLGELDALELPNGVYTSFSTNPGVIGSDVASIRVVVNAVNDSGSEHFFLDNIAVGTTIGPPPPLVATITRNRVTGENLIEWNTDGVSLYEIRYGDLNNWQFLASDSNLGSFTHTPPVGDERGYYQVRRFDD